MSRMNVEQAMIAMNSETESENSDMDIDQQQFSTYVLPTYKKPERSSSLQMNQAYRTKNKKHDPANLQDYSDLIQQLIISLTNLTKTHSQDFYPKQHSEVMTVLQRAYFHNENNSLLLLSRTKQTLHSFISAVSDDITNEITKRDNKSELKVIRVNSILSNSETKILTKLCESLKLKHAAKAFHSLEMVNYIQKYFEDNPAISVLFILEDVDYYVETTKQVLLYKILDMFQYLKIKFVFIATSIKVDIVDSFEKRIKSRFSHRMVLFYEQTLESFTTNMQKIFNDLLDAVAQPAQRSQINQLQSIVISEETNDALQEEYDFGKNYEYLCQMLRIALSSLDQMITKKMLVPPEEQIQNSKVFEFLKKNYITSLSQFSHLKQLSEPIKIFENLPKASLIVLISAKKVAERATVFNFDAVFGKYKSFMKNHQQVGLPLSKQVFLKIFLDLVHQGFLKSENECEILNVNNKTALGFREKELTSMLENCKDKLGLSHVIHKWAVHQS